MNSARGKKATKLDQQRINDEHAQITAINKAQPVSQYDMDGIVLEVNQSFEQLLGYGRDELIGKPVTVLVDEATRNSPEYQSAFKQQWERLRRGEVCSGESKRTTKQEKEIWIHYSYNPILDPDGRPYKVVNYFRDVTQQKLMQADFQGQIAAISKAQAVIEFNMDGTVITANDNFLNALGYTLDEIKGKHHSLFVDEAYKQSSAYKEFWAKLNRGKYDATEYKRIGKGGREVWIQASYNPILDLNGKPFKVVKYATDVTQQKLIQADFQGQIAAISKAQAVIEFSMDGTVLTANDNFLKALGYTLDEIKGHLPVNLTADAGTARSSARAAARSAPKTQTAADSSRANRDHRSFNRWPRRSGSVTSFSARELAGPRRDRPAHAANLHIPTRSTAFRKMLSSGARMQIRREPDGRLRLHRTRRFSHGRLW